MRRAAGAKPKARRGGEPPTGRDAGRIRGARPGQLPTFLEPSLACPCARPPSGPNWIHEIKYDGYRLQARVDEGRLRLLTRKGLDWTDRFPSISESVLALDFRSAWLDGEIVAEDENGIPSFNCLQIDLTTGRHDRLRYFLFDALFGDGFDLTQATLIDRKEFLAQSLAKLPVGSPLRFSGHLEEDGPTVLEHACRMGLEGIVSKRKDFSYRPGRGTHWLKSKCVERQEFVILGYIPSRAAPGAIASLLLGYYDRGELAYAETNDAVNF